MPTEPAVFASQVAASPRPGMSGLLGREIGQYRIASQLGKGACGTVYLAHHKMLNMPVAVKVLDPMHAKHAPEILRRFLHEARTAARVVHPNLVRVLDCGELNSLHFIVMEFVDGVSVLELIRMNGRLSEDTALSIVFAVAEGLEAALAEGIVHRDIKPANIMITKTKQVKLADMGLAKISNDEWSETAPNTGMGTPHYFAPEQAEDASAVDHRADIYSLGCSFYHMLYGKVPFEAQTIAEMIYKHRYEMPVPLVRAVPGITPELSILVDRMMAKQPVDRPQTYQDIIRSLQECRLSQRSTESRGASTSFMRRFLDGIFPGSRAGG